ncbi:Galactose oxidase [Nocardiopsis gilva]
MTGPMTQVRPSVHLITASLFALLLNASCAQVPTDQEPPPPSAAHTSPSPFPPRMGHTSIATGNGVIIWGGHEEDQSRPEASGALYDPAQDSWTPIPQSPLAPRTRHSAVWTGKEMIIWGGSGEEKDGGRFLRDGAAYDPATQEWRKIRNAPFPISSASALYHSRHIFMGPGSPTSRDDLGKLAVYSLLRDSWETIDIGLRVYGIAPLGESSIAVVGESEGRTEVLEYRIGARGVREIISRGAADQMSSITLVADGSDVVLVLVPESSSSEVHVIDPDGNLVKESDVSGDLHGQVDMVQYPLGRGEGWLHGESVVSISDRGLSRVDLRTMESRSWQPKEFRGRCGGFSASSLMNDDIFVWGGRSCEGSALDAETAGLVVSL